MVFNGFFQTGVSEEAAIRNTCGSFSVCCSFPLLQPAPIQRLLYIFFLLEEASVVLRGPSLLPLVHPFSISLPECAWPPSPAGFRVQVQRGKSPGLGHKRPFLTNSVTLNRTTSPYWASVCPSVKWVGYERIK